MTRLFAPRLPIAVDLDSHARPTRFALHGRSHRLAQVVQRWEVDTDWWRPEGRIARAYCAAITTDGLFCVFYQVLDGEGGWFLEKVYD